MVKWAADNRTTVIACVVALLAVAPALGEVTLTETPEQWRVSNGLIEVAIERERNYIRSLKPVGGPELIAEGGGYWDSVGTRDVAGERRQCYSRLGHHMSVVSEVVRRTPDLVDLCVRTSPTAFDEDKPLHLPLEIAVHYVVRAGIPGVYMYAQVRHPAEAQAMTFGQTRHVLRCDPEVLRGWRVSDERFGMLASSEEFAVAETIADATFRLPNGEIVTKYQYSLAARESRVFGLSAEDGSLGLWVIEPDADYRNGGPTKQNLTVQNGAIMQCEVYNAHYVGPSAALELGGEWAKVYGPWLYYVNEGASADELWRDVQARASLEAEASPYAWCSEVVGEDAYPSVRGSVQGSVVDAEGAPVAEAWLVLGAAEPDWQSQGLGYLYWARADDAGRYLIDKVRAGTYTAYAWREGMVGEGRVAGIEVRAGEVADGGEVRMPAEEGGLVWRIGTPDRSASEFRRGDDFRHWNILRFYPGDFPGDVTFTVGHSRERTDWNCVQPGPTVHEDRTRTQHPWTVVFDLDAASDCTLTVAAADCSYRPPAGIEVSVNGENAGRVQLQPGDSSAYRCGIQGYYQLATLAIAAGLLRAGENRMALVLPNSGAWVMYDFVELRTAAGN